MPSPPESPSNRPEPPARLRCRSAFPGRPEKLVPWHAEHRTALQALRAGGQPIASSCSGETVCGRCIVLVLGGGEGLSPVSTDELAVLENRDAEPGERLACRLERREVAGELVLSTHYW